MSRELDATYGIAVDELALREQEGGTYLELRVTPRASRNAVTGVREGALKLSLTAAPVDGAANDAVIALLAKALGVPKRALHIVKGEHARKKVVRVDGIEAAGVRAALAAVSER